MKLNAIAVAAVAGLASASPVEPRQNGGGDGPYGPGVSLSLACVSFPIPEG